MASPRPPGEKPATNGDLESSPVGSNDSRVYNDEDVAGQSSLVRSPTESGEASDVNIVNENTPLLRNIFRHDATVGELEDNASARLTVKRPAMDSMSAQSVTGELSDLLSNQGMNGGFSSPALLTIIMTWLYDLYKRYPKCSHTLLAVAALILILYFYIMSHGQAIFEQAALIDVETVSITGLCETGVNAFVSTSIKFDYSQVGNLFNRFLGISVSLLLGKVNIKPLSPIDFFVKLQGYDDEHRVVRVIPPETTVELGNNKYTTLEFDTTIGVISTSAVSVANKLISLRAAGQQFVDIFVSGSFTFDIENSVRNYKGITYDIERMMTIDVVPQIEGSFIDTFEFKLNEGPLDSIDIETSVVTRALKLPVSFNFDAVTWDLMLPLCSRDYLQQIGDATTEEIKIRPLSKVSLSSSINFPPLSPRLLRKCGSHGLSPLNQFIIDFLTDNLSRNIFMSASDSADNQLPQWLKFILERVTIPIPLSYKDFVCATAPLGDYLQSLEIHDSLIELDDKNDSIMVSSGVEIILTYPPYLKDFHDFKIPRLRNNILISNGDQNFTHITSNEWQFATINYTENYIIITLELNHLKVNLLDPNVTSVLLNKYLSGESTELITYSDLDVELESSIVDTTLSHLPFTVDVDLPNFVSGGLISNTNTTIENIFLVESNETSLTLMMDIQVTNPFPISFNSQKLPISLYFASEDVKLGEIKTMQIPIIPGNETFNASVLLEIKPRFFKGENPERSTTKLEKFLSGYLSGNDSEITMIGHEDSLPSFTDLSKVLTNLSVDISLPHSGNSEFILSSTMHIMTSEIEFEIFNPVNNSEVMIEIIKARASIDGTTLGYLERQERLIIPPGVYKTPRLPINFASGIGGNILRRALNGDLQIHGDAMFKFTLDEFSLDLVYSGEGLTANVRL